MILTVQSRSETAEKVAKHMYLEAIIKEQALLHINLIKIGSFLRKRRCWRSCDLPHEWK